MSYGQIGVMQALGGFFCWLIVMAESGFLSRHLYGVREEWISRNVNDFPDSYGQSWVSNCLVERWSD